jgi:hypothetical protein
MAMIDDGGMQMMGSRQGIALAMLMVPSLAGCGAPEDLTPPETGSVLPAPIDPNYYRSDLSGCGNPGQDCCQSGGGATYCLNQIDLIVFCAEGVSGGGNVCVSQNDCGGAGQPCCLGHSLTCHDGFTCIGTADGVFPTCQTSSVMTPCGGEWEACCGRTCGINLTCNIQTCEPA